MPVSGNYESRNEKYVNLRKAFKKLKVATTNEAINYIYENDLKKGTDYMLNRGWRYYNHLNKQTIRLHRNGAISLIGTKVGELKKEEKVFEYRGDK